jgi:hypothetical protein
MIVAEKKKEEYVHAQKNRIQQKRHVFGYFLIKKVIH